MTVSMNWIVPLVKSTFDPNYTYLPVIWKGIANAGLGDDFQYYAYVREVLDFNFMSFSGAFEGKDRPSIYSTYYLSIFFGSIGGFFSNTIDTALFFNLFVTPALLFLITRKILMKVSGITDPWVSFLSFCMSLYHADFMINLKVLWNFCFGHFEQAGIITNMRFPNESISVFFLSLTGYFLYLLFRERDVNKFIFLLSSILIGTSGLFSVQNGLITTAMVVMYFIFISKEQRIKWGKLIALSTVFAIPTIYIWGQIFFQGLEESTLREAFEFYGGDWHEFREKDLINQLFHFKVILLATLGVFINKKQDRSPLLICYSIFIIFLIMALTKGTWASSRMYRRGGFLLLSSFGWASIFCSIRGLLRRDYFRFVKVHYGLYRRVYFMAFVSILGASSVINLFNQYSNTTKYLELYNYKEEKELYTWINNNLNKKSSIVSFNLEISSNIPVHTSANSYIPNLLRSPFTREEIMSRFLETLIYFGIDDVFFTKYLNDAGARNINFKTDEYLLQTRMFQMVCYYWNFKAGLSKKEIVKIRKRLVELKQMEKNNFQYNNTHVLVSHFEKELVGKGSELFGIISRKEPIYKNEKFELYEL